MSVSSDTCRGGVAPRLVSEDARVQGYSKCAIALVFFLYMITVFLIIDTP